MNNKYINENSIRSIVIKIKYTKNPSELVQYIFNNQESLPANEYQYKLNPFYKMILEVEAPSKEPAVQVEHKQQKHQLLK